MKLSDFDYTLPPDRIAQHPVTPRDAAKLLVVDRDSGHMTHHVFRELPEYLHSEDVLVINDTRVIPARLRARKSTGGDVEVLLLRPVPSPGHHVPESADNAEVWEVLLRPARRAPVRTRLQISEDLMGEVTAALPEGARLVTFRGARRVLDVARDIGEMPVPPYVHEPLQHPDDYQTVYAATDGAVAAPTAGLHFTPTLLDQIARKGVRVVSLTLHIGWGTFRPVTADDPTAHRMGAEWYEVSEAAAQTITRARGRGRVVAVGTSVVRTLETVAATGGIRAARGWSELFIYPGYRFAAIDGLVTNFHLPKTTLLMLVSAFAGRELVLRAYHEAIAQGYRFYSFGDAMLIL